MFYPQLVENKGDTEENRLSAASISDASVFLRVLGG